MTEEQIKKLQVLDISNVSIKAVNRHTSKVFDARAQEISQKRVFNN